MPGVPRLLWLETTPQHFHGADGTGLFADKKKPVSCRAVLNRTAAAWRNDHFEQWVRTPIQFEELPPNPQLFHDHWRIVRQFDALLPMQLMHPVNDCTHFCYSPFLYGPAWDGIGAALVER